MLSSYNVFHPVAVFTVEKELADGVQECGRGIIGEHVATYVDRRRFLKRAKGWLVNRPESYFDFPLTVAEKRVVDTHLRLVVWRKVSMDDGSRDHRTSF